MKKFTLILLGFFAYTLVHAQSNAEEIQIMQSLFGMEKKALVAEFIQLDIAEHGVFWALYDQYEAERKDLGKNRIDLIKQYAEHYNDMTDEQASKLISQMITQRKATDKLMEAYYKKILKATDPIVAMQFYQIEGYIPSAIRIYILGEVPFVQK
ncbi:MAG: hypothetical protein KBB71_04350 [Lentimicrobiaceae bacterium]|nr:hypothetical protein [Lentimicrobiaceae bacterium]